MRLENWLTMAEHSGDGIVAPFAYCGCSMSAIFLPCLNQMLPSQPRLRGGWQSMLGPRVAQEVESDKL